MSIVVSLFFLVKLPPPQPRRPFPIAKQSISKRETSHSLVLGLTYGWVGAGLEGSALNVGEEEGEGEGEGKGRIDSSMTIFSSLC